MGHTVRKACVTVIVICVCILLILPITAKLEKQAYPLKYEDIINEYTSQYGVDKAFVYALIRTESSFKSDAVSSVDARGLMQLTQSAFDWVKMKSGFDGEFDDMFDAQTNIKYGVYMLKLLLEEFENETNALCAYHAGWGITKEWLSDGEITPDGKTVKNIPYSDTAWYVKKVLESRDIYNKLYFEKGE